MITAFLIRFECEASIHPSLSCQNTHIATGYFPMYIFGRYISFYLPSPATFVVFAVVFNISV